MKIEKIQLFTCKMPLKIPFQHASSGLITELEGVFVKLCTDENVCGYGEVRGNCSYFTGDTTGSVLATIRECIAPKLKGKDPLCINELHQVTHGRRTVLKIWTGDRGGTLFASVMKRLELLQSMPD
jgi:L-alanine-DL-glutamate epimerase-like enolase superfamily enzyme